MNVFPNLPNTWPKVSVIIPVRNCRQYIVEAIDSILAQDFSNFEIIVVDDGSDDFDYKTLESRDPRIMVFRQDGKGVSSARNHGIERCKGEFIAFLDADDVWLPGKLTAQIMHMQAKPNTGVVFGRYIRWSANSDGTFAPPSDFYNQMKMSREIDPARSGWIYSKLLLGLLVGMNTAVVRRSTIDSVGGFNESMTHGEDYDFWLRCSRVAEMDSLHADVALYRMHPQSAMHKLTRVDHLSILLNTAEMRWGLTNTDGNSISQKEFQYRKGEVHFMFGYSHFWYGQTINAQQAFKSSFRYRFLPIRSLAYWLTASIRQGMKNLARHS